MEAELFIKELMPGIYLLDEGHMASGYLVVGEEKACVIDTMNGLNDIHAAVRKITDKPIILINTHGHPDHIFGNIYFKEEAYLNPKDLEMAESFKNHPEFAKACEERGVSMPPFKPVNEGDVFDLGGRTLEVYELPGHTLLGLDAGASEEQVRERAGALLSASDELSKKTAELDSLKTAQAQAELSHVERLVDAAVREMRITADKRERYVELGKQIGSCALEQLLGDMRPVGKISETLAHGETGGVTGEWKKLSDVPESELLTLRKSDPNKYAALYKAEYGMEPTLEE